MPKLPSFETLKKHFPAGSPEAAKKVIGGNIDMDWVTNTCAVRVSHSLNLAGRPIPVKFGQWDPKKFSARGGNGMRYVFRVQPMIDYLKKTYGAPDLSHHYAKGDAHDVPASFAGKQGVIWFDVKIWKDATGHVDLWDGAKCLGSCYFKEAEAVHLWVAP